MTTYMYIFKRRYDRPYEVFAFTGFASDEGSIPKDADAAWKIEGDLTDFEARDAVLMQAADQYLGSGITITRLIPREPTNDEKIEAARRVLRADYWDDVRRVAEDFKENVESGHITSLDEAETWLHESVDGTQRVIYTGQAIEGLLYTDHESAFVDEFGEEGLVESGDVNWSGLMYSALMADVRKTLGDIEDLIAEAETACYSCGLAFTEDDDTDVEDYSGHRHRIHDTCPEQCDECGTVIDDGEGYDGKCGACADKEEGEDE